MPKKDAHMLRNIIERNRPELKEFEELYRRLHQNPELSGQEAETASEITRFLQRYEEIEVLEAIGGYGVVGIFKNGKGPTILLRSDMDALPMEELTGLPYASKKKMRNKNGEVVPVFHGCGHDMHVACLLAATQLLLSAHLEWSGTIIILFQPAEETFKGAQAMVDDHLYNKIPTPGILLAQHSTKDKAGTLLITGGPILTACDSFDIRINGRGGHGSSPADCLDPIVTAAYALVRLQAIVSREINPHEFAVVTCGNIHAGNSAAIIPDTACLRVDARAYDEKVLEKIQSSVKKIVEAECQAAGMDKSPDIKHTRGAPPTSNDEHAANILAESFKNMFGKNTFKMAPDTASEDFSLLARPNTTPYVYWNFGTTDPAKWDESKRKNELHNIPGNHSSHFSPVIEPTLRTGTDAMALAALTFLS